MIYFCILQAYTAAMQTQWGWLLQLTVCLETHMRHAAAYHGWWNQAREADKFMSTQTNRLNTYYSRPHVTLDEGEKLIREMQVSVSRKLGRHKIFGDK